LETIARLNLHLPGRQEASELVQVFFAQFGMLFYGISQPHIRGVIIPALYDSGSMADTDAHRLGLLFAIFAIASLVRAPMAERLVVASHYAQLSLAALGAVSIFQHPSLETVQAVHLRALFEFMLQNGGEETGRAYMSFACQLCYIVSIHSTTHHRFSDERLQLGLRALTDTQLVINDLIIEVSQTVTQGNGLCHQTCASRDERLFG
jgi:hypothetical protein